MNAELPPLPPMPPVTAKTDASVRHFIIALFDVMQARERILQARIAELEADRDSWKEQAEARVEDWAKEYERAKQLEADARRIAVIAHQSGLVGYDADDALCDIRALTLNYWNTSGTRAEAMQRVHAAIDAAREVK